MEILSTDTRPPLGPQRRSPRVSLCVAVELRHGQDIGASTTVRVNRHGALVRLSRLLPIGSMLEMRNLVSGEAGRFRVAWVGPADQGTRLFDIGVEMLDVKPSFWGARYEHLSVRALSH